MKQNLRLGDFYCPKQIQTDYQLYPQKAPDKRNTYSECSRTRPAFLRTFFSLSPDIYYEFINAYLSRAYQNLSQNSDTGYSWLRRWQNKGRRKSGVSMLGLGKLRPMPCSSPPSLTLPSGPIPICPAYISVKSPKSGTLAKGKRLHSGRKGHTDTERVGRGPDWHHAGDRLGSASELGASSEPSWFALDRLQPNQGTTKSKPRPNQGTAELRSHLQECPERRLTVARPSTAWDWFEYGNTILRRLLGCASAFCRSVVEGFSKPRRTIVEALSKDCRTSLEQQSNTRRRNSEESCVWTHAKAPARSGLGLALGMVVFFVLAMGTGLHAQTSVQNGTLVDSIRPLQIGDTIPDALWHLQLQVVNHPEGKDTVTLNDYRNKKLIVLDFWATWCKPCIKSVMKLDTIVADLGEENIALLPVQVYDLVPNAHRFIEKRDWHLPTIVGDTLLNKVAFYNYLTGFGVVWLADGKLLAVPQSKDVNRSNVIKALRREPLNIEHRKGYPLLTQ